MSKTGPIYNVVDELESTVRQSIWFGGSSLVPLFVATCPECGERLRIRCQEWISDSGKPISVEYECEGDRDGDTGHGYYQSEWQPVMDSVAEWFGIGE